jgi:predicted AlkP superfamily phosphohydrolase/phosphomutase
MSDRLVLAAVDGLDWERVRRGIRAGRLPTLKSLLDSGAFAEVAVSACVPGLGGAEEGMNSPTLWTTVATGQYYFQHGVYDFSNLLDSVEHPPLFESRHVLSPRLWDVLGACGVSSVVVGYYVTHPAYAINGVMVSDLFGESRDRKVVWPAERCDEFARLLGAADYESYVQRQEPWALPTGESGPIRDWACDSELRSFGEAVLARFTDLDEAGRAILLDSETESLWRRLVWFRLISPLLRDEALHKVFLSLLAGESWRFATAYYRLIDFVGHGFWTEGNNLPPEFAHAYGPVVDRAYEQMDRLLGEIVRALDDDDRLIVVSDHGFTAQDASVELTPEMDLSTFSYGQHQEPAVLIARSAGVGAGEFKNVSLLDVAPTILDYFGVPQADTLDGGPVPGLLHAGAPRPLARVACYPYNRPEDSGYVSEAEERLVLERLAALGYLDA